MSNKKSWKKSKGRASPSIRILRRRRRLSKHAFLTERASQMKRRPTGAESVFAQKLDNLEIKYEEQWVVDYKGIAAIYDFYIPTLRLLVEVDGGYHSTETQKQTDRIKTFIAEQRLKRDLLRLTNEQVIAISDEDLRQLIYGAKGKRHQVRAS